MDSKAAEPGSLLELGLAGDGYLRWAAVDLTEVVREVRDRRDMGPVATAALGRCLGGAALLLRLAAKTPTRLSVEVRGDGPILRIFAEADQEGNLRGMVGDERVDVFAPGEDIRTADHGGDFQVNSGTSFAAPVVSGLAALIMAHYPELDALEVRDIILESARDYRQATVERPGAGDPVPFGELSVTGGIVDARAALELAAKRASGTT